jgi:hypothetical protein
MNNDCIVNDLRKVLESAGLEVCGVYHPRGMTVEFTTSPPLTWNWADCDRAIAHILHSMVCGKRLDHAFSQDHDRSHSFWRFRIEDYAILRWNGECVTA